MVYGVHREERHPLPQLSTLTPTSAQIERGNSLTVRRPLWCLVCPTRAFGVRHETGFVSCRKYLLRAAVGRSGFIDSTGR